MPKGPRGQSNLQPFGKNQWLYRIGTDVYEAGYEHRLSASALNPEQVVIARFRGSSKFGRRLIAAEGQLVVESVRELKDQHFAIYGTLLTHVSKKKPEIATFNLNKSSDIVLPKFAICGLKRAMGYLVSVEAELDRVDWKREEDIDLPLEPIVSEDGWAKLIPGAVSEPEPINLPFPVWP